MALRRLTRLELRLMGALWEHGAFSVCAKSRAFSRTRPSCVHDGADDVYRLEAKHALPRAKKDGNAHVFDDVESRRAAQRRFVDDLFDVFGGRIQPVMPHLIESGCLTLEDVKRAEQLLRQPRKRRSS